MNKDLKRTFFVCLLSVLLVISNIVCLKYTNFLGLTVGAEFTIFPFTFLCTLLLFNYGGKKEAYRGILVAGIIQLLICISYVLITCLEPQRLITDQGTLINILFKVDEMRILSSVFAFIISHLSLIYLYDSFKNIKKELYGLVMGLLCSMTLYSIVYIVLTMTGYEPLFVIDLILANVIISIVMSVIMTILFYIFKEKDLITVDIKDMKTDVKNDLSALDLIEEKEIKTKKTTTKKKNTTSKTKSTSNSKTKSYSKKSDSKTKVDNKNNNKKPNNSKPKSQVNKNKK